MNDGKRANIGFGTKVPPAASAMNILTKKNIKIKKAATGKE